MDNKDENSKEKKESIDFKSEGQANESKSETVSKKDYDELKDRMMRLAAEFDNYKKRSASEISSAKVLGKVTILKALLPILDEFELAAVAANESKDENLSKGIKMVYANMLSVLKAEGMEEITADGKYDPYYHEIIMTKDSDSKPGTVLEVIKKGYKVDGIMVRPTSVIVASESTGADIQKAKEPEPQHLAKENETGKGEDKKDKKDVGDAK